MKLFSTSSLAALICSGALLLCAAPAWAAYDAIQFMHIVSRDDAGSLKKALAEGQFNANTLNHEGQTALYVALREPSPKVASLLIARPDTDLNRENAFGENALMMAALRGQLAQAEQLIARGAEVNKKGWAPLHYAASSGHVAMLRLLLEHHAYIDAESPAGETPLMMAASRAKPDAVQLLLESGADASVKNQAGQTAYALALARKNTRNAAVIERWLAQGQPAASSATPQPTQSAVGVEALYGSGSASGSNYRSQWDEAAD